MRCTQFIGLNEKALMYLNENCIKEKQEKCPTCGHITGGNLINHTYDMVTGMFDEEVADLRVYKHKDGSEVREIVQATPWSSGPVIFLCLQYKGRNICKWAKKHIDKC